MGQEPVVVNALSDWLEVEVLRDGVLYTQTFKTGGDKVSFSSFKY